MVFQAIAMTAASGQTNTPARPGTNQELGSFQNPALQASYVLGAGDQIIIRAFEVEEIGEKPYRIDTDGYVAVPLVGRIKAGGLTVEQFEQELTTKLKTIIRNPQVSVSIAQFRSEPVFFVGAFKQPGIYPLQGRRTLIEMLASIGGLQPNASRRIRVTRRMEFGNIPLPNTVEHPDRKVTSVEISVGSLTENVNPAEDIELKPYDLMAVERAELVYINGEVGKVGAFELGERDSMSVSQAVTLAGGLSREAAPEKARILRPVLNTSRRAEIPLDLKKILAGQQADFPLMPNDLLYIPRNNKRAILTRAALYALPIIPTIIVLATR